MLRAFTPIGKSSEYIFSHKPRTINLGSESASPLVGDCFMKSSGGRGHRGIAGGPLGLDKEP